VGVASTLLPAAPAADAATFITTKVLAQPTPGLPDYITGTLTATSTAGKIIGFNFAGGFQGFGIQGTFNQVNPFGFPTLFDDLSPEAFLAADSDIKADSHFLVKSDQGLIVGARERPIELQAAFNFLNFESASNSLEFVQLAMHRSTAGWLRGQFTVMTPQGDLILEDVDRVFSIPPFPEFNGACMAAMGWLGLATYRRRPGSRSERLTAVAASISSARSPIHHSRVA
jgi:hypothetical protein